MIDLVFERKTEGGLIELEEIVTKLEKENKNASLFSLENEVAFHGKLYQMSGNKTLQRFQEILLPVFQYVHANKLSDTDTYMYSKKFVTYHELFNYLKQDDIELFRIGMRKHLEPHFDRIFNKVIT